MKTVQMNYALSNLTTFSTTSCPFLIDCATAAASGFSTKVNDSNLVYCEVNNSDK